MRATGSSSASFPRHREQLRQRNKRPHPGSRGNQMQYVSGWMNNALRCLEQNSMRPLFKPALIAAVISVAPTAIAQNG